MPKNRLMVETLNFCVAMNCASSGAMASGRNRAPLPSTAISRSGPRASTFQRARRVSATGCLISWSDSMNPMGRSAPGEEAGAVPYGPRPNPMASRA